MECSSGVGGGWESARKNNIISCQDGQWDPTRTFIFFKVSATGLFAFITMFATSFFTYTVAFMFTFYRQLKVKTV